MTAVDRPTREDTPMDDDGRPPLPGDAETRQRQHSADAHPGGIALESDRCAAPAPGSPVEQPEPTGHDHDRDGVVGSDDDALAYLSALRNGPSGEMRAVRARAACQACLLDGVAGIAVRLGAGRPST